MLMCYYHCYKDRLERDLRSLVRILRGPTRRRLSFSEVARPGIDISYT